MKEVLAVSVSKSPRNKRASPKIFDYGTTEKYLISILDSSERPLKMGEVAQRLNIDQRTIYGYFPNLCRIISAKYHTYQKQQTAQRIQKCCQEIEQAVCDLHQAGEYRERSSRIAINFSTWIFPIQGSKKIFKSSYIKLGNLKLCSRAEA